MNVVSNSPLFVTQTSPYTPSAISPASSADFNGNNSADMVTLGNLSPVEPTLRNFAAAAPAAAGASTSAPAAQTDDSVWIPSTKHRLVETPSTVSLMAKAVEAIVLGDPLLLTGGAGTGRQPIIKHLGRHQPRSSRGVGLSPSAGQPRWQHR